MSKIGSQGMVIDHLAQAAARSGAAMLVSAAIDDACAYA